MSSADVHREMHKSGSTLRDFILGGQDGLVNVLGIILGVATAVQDARIVIIAGIAATFAESISMAAVAYTSFKASRDFYKSEKEREMKEIRELPHVERKEIRDIYYRKGFRGAPLKKIVDKITSDKKVWLDTMMTEELHVSPEDSENPTKSAFVVGFSAIIGSLIPLLPFFFIPIKDAIIVSVIISTITLFIAGSVKAKMTLGTWWKSGIEMSLVGMAAALTGFLIGSLLGVWV
ncbi:MAG: VIT1/CCC1 transporter family protein [Candidatus Aenigmarchaeota archaeon]|nr:VIT1/CCC1 transporter family protein [Candidatus Aenigmarchaeota archaeon]